MDKKETSYTDTLLIYTLWYEFSNDCDAQSVLCKQKFHKKSTHLDHSYIKYALIKSSIFALYFFLLVKISTYSHHFGQNSNFYA